MPRTIWKGALSFGLVNIPVGVYPATSDKSIHFNQFEEGTSDRIRYKRVNERTGDEVANDRIVRGFDLGGGEYVILSDEELESAEPKKSRQIEISDFVGLADIDPVYFRTSYYLAPEGAGSDKAYALLRRAMSEAGRIGIATMVMRNKEYLVAIRPEDDALALHTMYFSDEVRCPSTEISWTSPLKWTNSASRSVGTRACAIATRTPFSKRASLLGSHHNVVLGRGKTNQIKA